MRLYIYNLFSYILHGTNKNYGNYNKKLKLILNLIPNFKIEVLNKKKNGVKFTINLPSSTKEKDPERDLKENKYPRSGCSRYLDRINYDTGGTS